MAGPIDFASVECELRNARQARVNVELSCSELEDLAQTIRRLAQAARPDASETRPPCGPRPMI